MDYDDFVVGPAAIWLLGRHEESEPPGSAGGDESPRVPTMTRFRKLRRGSAESIAKRSR
jgi:hypothetical protein